MVVRAEQRVRADLERIHASALAAKAEEWQQRAQEGQLRATRLARQLAEPAWKKIPSSVH